MRTSDWEKKNKAIESYELVTCLREKIFNSTVFCLLLIYRRPKKKHQPTAMFNFRIKQLILTAVLVVCSCKVGLSFAYPKRGAVGNFRRRSLVVRPTKTESVDFREETKTTPIQVAENQVDDSIKSTTLLEKITEKYFGTIELGIKSVLLTVLLVSVLFTQRRPVSQLFTVIFEAYKSALVNQPLRIKSSKWIFLGLNW